jgi:hypothetical protein
MELEYEYEEALDESYELDGDFEDLDEMDDYDADLVQPEKLFPGRSGWHAD